MNIVAVNELMVDEINRLNRKFVVQAIREWDLRGEGNFATWIQMFLVLKWKEMAISN